VVTKRDLKLARNIRLFRRKAGLTQEEMAERLKMSLTVVGYYEIGKRQPRLKTLYRIADILKVKVKDLINY